MFTNRDCVVFMSLNNLFSDICVDFHYFCLPVNLLILRRDASIISSFKARRVPEGLWDIVRSFYVFYNSGSQEPHRDTFKYNHRQSHGS